MMSGGSFGRSVDSGSSNNQTPLNHGLQLGGGGPSGTRGGLNEKLNTEYIDVAPDDTSVSANMTRTIAGFVGKCCTPRQMLVVLRLLKAITFCFIVLTIASDLMYIFFVELIASNEVNVILGGFRDTVIRIYGLGLAVMAILIELDMANAVKNFSGFKGFVPRGLLLFFVSTITNAHPLHRQKSCSGHRFLANDDDNYDDDRYSSQCLSSNDIPGSAIVFQMVTSFVLGCCALTYFVLGVMCFDRFTSRAFLSDKDPLVVTAIPQPNAPGGHTGEGAEGDHHRYEPA